MSEEKKTIELKDEELEKVSGGGFFAFNYDQCPCGNFSPYDGNASNTKTSNCSFYVSMASASCDACFPNGVCRHFK